MATYYILAAVAAPIFFGIYFVLNKFIKASEDTIDKVFDHYNLELYWLKTQKILKNYLC